MSAFIALVRKHLSDTRWMLGLSALALFWFSWLSVYFATWSQQRMREFAREDRARMGQRVLRSMGGEGMDISAAAMEMQAWVHPFFVLPMILWAISRGSLAVAGEIERGTMDLTLSRPVSRWNYLSSQVIVAMMGCLGLAAAAVLGNLGGTRFNPIEAPPSVAVLLRPAASYAALGFAVFGYTLLLSSMDIVRWRPNLIASVATFCGYVAFAISVFPQMAESRWKPWLEKGSIFTAYNPVAAVGKAEHLALHLGVLAAIGAVGVFVSFVAFRVRDLPTSG